MINRLLLGLRAMHTKCRNGLYPRSKDVNRFPVPDEKVSWLVEWPAYQPPQYTAPHIRDQPWADPDLLSDFKPKWNSLDVAVDRRSYEGPYKIEEGRPVNPRGRTGLGGRGCLGRWGPNHAADPIVTRWKTAPDGSIAKDETSGLPMLQFVAIQRGDCGEWALPGGMVDPGEPVSATLRREFMEEALNALQLEPTHNAHALVDRIFENGREVFRGYVDDPRNTDNAWMETVAMHYHDEKGTTTAKLALHAGDDASKVTWMDVDHSLHLYASHRHFIQQVANNIKCHW